MIRSRTSANDGRIETLESAMLSPLLTVAGGRVQRRQLFQTRELVGPDERVDLGAGAGDGLAAAGRPDRARRRPRSEDPHVRLVLGLVLDAHGFPPSTTPFVGRGSSSRSTPWIRKSPSASGPLMSSTTSSPGAPMAVRPRAEYGQAHAPLRCSRWCSSMCSIEAPLRASEATAAAFRATQARERYSPSCWSSAPTSGLLSHRDDRLGRLHDVKLRGAVRAEPDPRRRGPRARHGRLLKSWRPDQGLDQV